MKRKKMTLNDLKLKSFALSLEGGNPEVVKGGVRSHDCYTAPIWRCNK